MQIEVQKERRQLRNGILAIVAIYKLLMNSINLERCIKSTTYGLTTDSDPELKLYRLYWLRFLDIPVQENT